MQNSNHEKIKRNLKIIGFLMIALGIILTIIGFINVIISVNKEELPSLFWLLFIGIPMIPTGIFFIAFGYRREITNYVKNESVPIINKLGNEIKPAITSVTKAVKDGIIDKGVVCDCGNVNETGSKYCSKCGKQLFKKCDSCGALVDSSSTFCNHCGNKINS